MNVFDVLNQNSLIADNLNISLKRAKGGESVVEMHIDEKVLNPYQIVHGGAIFTLGDTAAGAAALSYNEAYVTMDSYINFIQPGVGKKLIATGKTIYKGPETCVVDVEIKNNKDVLIAKGMYTMYKVEISA